MRNDSQIMSTNIWDCGMWVFYFEKESDILWESFLGGDSQQEPFLVNFKTLNVPVPGPATGDWFTHCAPFCCFLFIYLKL